MQVAFDFWRRCEVERAARNWTKEKVFLVSGVSRTTYNNLEVTTRKPQPRVVHALADAFDIPWTEADVLAGIIPPGRAVAGDVGVVAAIQASNVYTEDQKRILLGVVETIDKANGREAQTPPPSAHQAYGNDAADAH